MNAKKLTLAILTLLLIGGTAGVLVRVKAKQTLGLPAVTTRPLPGSLNLEVVLPEFVLDYTSEEIEQDKIAVATLPADTSYGQRLYKAPDGFWAVVNVVLMGSDRTSLHKPQYCLEGAGWKIDGAASSREIIRMTRPREYDLPVMRIVASRQVDGDGPARTLRRVYVYWFVADDALSGDPTGFERMWSMARQLLTTGVLQRWAYVTYSAVCLPGQEEATYQRLKKFITSSVPEFQLTPKPQATVATAQAPVESAP
jgi:hypothetical protein